MMIIFPHKQERSHSSNFQGMAKQDCYKQVCGEELQSTKKEKKKLF